MADCAVLQLSAPAFSLALEAELACVRLEGLTLKLVVLRHSTHPTWLAFITSGIELNTFKPWTYVPWIRYFLTLDMLTP